MLLYLVAQNVILHTVWWKIWQICCKIEENLANISILRLKIIQQNWSISFKCVTDSLKKAYKTIVCDKILNINAIESCMGLNLRS